MENHSGVRNVKGEGAVKERGRSIWMAGKSTNEWVVKSIHEIK